MRAAFGADWSISLPAGPSPNGLMAVLAAARGRLGLPELGSMLMTPVSAAVACCEFGSSGVAIQLVWRLAWGHGGDQGRTRCAGLVADRSQGPFALVSMKARGPGGPAKAEGGRIVDGLDLGARIAYWRERRGMTQQLLADRVGRSKSWLEKVEAGTRNADRLTVLLILCRELRIDLPVLIGRDIERDTPEQPRRNPSDMSQSILA